MSKLFLLPVLLEKRKDRNTINSRLLYLETFEEHSNYTSALFIKNVVEKFPYAIEYIQTDNGLALPNRLANKTLKPTLFESALEQVGIRYKLICPFTPWHNGKVEYSHRKDTEEFYDVRKYYSFNDFMKQLAVRQHQYSNFAMTHPTGTHLNMSIFLVCNASLTNQQLISVFLVNGY